MKKHASLEKIEPIIPKSLVEEEQEIMQLEQALAGKQVVQRRIMEKVVGEVVSRMQDKMPRDEMLRGQVAKVLSEVEVLRDKMNKAMASDEELRELEREVLLKVKEKLEG